MLPKMFLGLNKVFVAVGYFFGGVGDIFEVFHLLATDEETHERVFPHSELFK